MGISDPVVKITGADLTDGTLTPVHRSLQRRTLHVYDWTNAMVVAAASSSNKIDVCTLPAKTAVARVWVAIKTAATQAATLTVQAGTAADTDGYVVASDAKAAANTVYGDAIAEQGALLFVPGDTDDYHLTNLPSYTGTTVVQIEFVIGAGTLADVTASTGRVVIESIVLPA